MARSELDQAQARNPGAAQQAAQQAVQQGTAPVATPQPISTSGLADLPPEMLRQRLATFLGIMQGDNYGVPQDVPPPPGTEHIFGATDPNDPNAAPNVLQSAIQRDTQNDPKSITAPANGGNIQSGSFAHDLLASLNLPVTFSNIQAINAWMRAETGSQGKGTPAFNPLATTQKFGSFTQFNGVGVKNYADYNTGVMATANVLVNGKYNNILQALSRGNDAMAVARAVAASPWGTGNGVIRVLEG